MMENIFYEFMITINAMIMLFVLFFFLSILFYMHKTKMAEGSNRSIEKTKERIITATSMIELHFSLNQLKAWIPAPRIFLSPVKRVTTKSKIEALSADEVLWTVLKGIDPSCTSLTDEQKEQILLGIDLHQKVKNAKRMNDRILRIGLALVLLFLSVVLLYFFIAECLSWNVINELPPYVALTALLIFSFSGLLPGLLFRFLWIRSTILYAVFCLLGCVSSMLIAACLCVVFFQSIDPQFFSIIHNAQHTYILLLFAYGSILSITMIHHQAQHVLYRIYRDNQEQIKSLETNQTQTNK